MTRTCVLCLLLTAAAPAAARVGVINLGPAYYEVTSEVQTPHIAWAKPLAGGPLRVLIVAPRRTQRETVELWQRLQIDYVAVGTEDTGVLGATPDPNGPVGGTLPEVEARLREALKKDYDVVITSGVHWKTLPPAVFESLVARVRTGTGLILVRPEDKPEGAFQQFLDGFRETPRPAWLLAGSRLENLPHYRKGEKDTSGPPDKVFSCFQCEKGRVARVHTGGSNWTYLVPDVGDTAGATLLDFEDQMAFAAKLVLWASGREPSAAVQTATADGAGATANVVVEAGPGTAGKATCRLTLRDRWGSVLTTASQAFDVVPGQLTLRLPHAPVKGGQHRAEVQLCNEAGDVFWWGTWPFPVTPAFGIARLSLETEEVPPGTPAKGTVELRGQPAAGARLVFQVTDSFNRVVSRSEQPAQPGPFSVLDAHPLALHHELAVTLVAGDRMLDEARARFATPIKGPGWDDFSFLFWHHSTEGAIGRLVNRELSRKYLADSLNCAAWQTPQRMEDILWCVAEDGLWATPYATHFGNYWGSGLVRGPCLSHPSLVQEKIGHMREVGLRLRKFCPPAYSLGDENVLDGKDTDVCFSPECQASFREYLKARYTSLDAVNAEWGTAFKDWPEVAPIAKKEALEKGQVPRWVDHRMHMNTVFANSHRLCRDATRQSDPQARVGFEGPIGQAGYNGHDLWKFSRFMDSWGPYPYAGEWYDAPRSFCPRGYYGGVWYGGYPDIRYDFHHRSWPWTAVTRGLSAAWWFNAYDGTCFGALAPDFRPYPDFVEGLKEIRRLKSGVGKLLMHASADYDPIGIHYSLESLYAALAYGTPAEASCSVLPFSQVLSEAGLSYRLVAPEQIANGALAGYKALLLPASQALSDNEAAAMRKFVEAGGLLIADVRPGVTDEHGKVRTAGVLDSLFGVKQDLALVGKSMGLREVSVTEGPLGKVDKLSLDPGVAQDPSATDVTCSGAGGSPYFLVRRVGQGKVLLLNFAARGGMDLGKALAPLFAGTGLKPRIVVADGKSNRVGTPLPYREGNAYTLVLPAQVPHPQHVTLPAPAHCYLADEGRYLGLTNKPVVEMDRNLWQRVLVCLPYSVTKLDMTRLPGDHPGEHKFHCVLTVEGAPAGYHVIRFTVTGPDGQERPCYAANVSAERGVGEHVLPLALNDPSGTWTATAMDVATGVKATVSWSSGDPEDKPRTVSRESIEYLQGLRKNTPFGTNGFDLAGLRAGMGSRREPTIQGVKLIRAKIDDTPCEWVLAPGAAPDVRLLYLHGGGFVSGSGGFYLAMAAHLSAAAKCAVLLPDYRLAPEHPFPDGLEDCIRAHQWLIANGPSGPGPAQATLIAGDSAGGNLTLATLLALRDRRLPLPAGGIAISPCTDWTLASDSLRTVDDPIISARTMPVFRDLYLGQTDPHNPLASPVFGDYRGIPPLLIQAGEHEMLRDDSIRVAKKVRADGIAVKLEIWPGMFHVFQSHEPLLPEARDAIARAAEFMRSLLPRR